MNDNAAGYLNIVIKEPSPDSASVAPRHSSAGQLNVFIPERQMSIDEVILQGQ